MNTEIFFTLAEYKQNYDKLKNDFINAYIDNDEEEFIALQTEWYQRCLDNTILEHGILADSVCWDTKAMFTGEGFVKVVDNIVRNERGGVIKETAQNLNVSFKKILKFLKKKSDTPVTKIGAEISAAQVMLYHYTLQEAKLEPPFPDGGKEKALETLSMRYGFSRDNLKKKYNVIMRGGKKGYSKDDAKKVQELIKNNYPTALPLFQDITKHILI